MSRVEVQAATVRAPKQHSVRASCEAPWATWPGRGVRVVTAGRRRLAVLERARQLVAHAEHVGVSRRELIDFMEGMP